TPDVGGTWSPALAGAGTYTYTVAATAPCATDATATVTVTEQAQPDAGTNGALSICTGGGANTDLFALLGGTPDATGTWNDDDGSGVVLTVPTDVDLSGLATGSYGFTYTVAATAPCTTNATATVTITITNQLNAGVDATVDICEGSGTNTDLFAALGATADAGGTWNDDDGSGVVLTVPTDVDLSGLTTGSYDFTYSHAAAAGCPA
uniref:hypothetical protein n=1 Tax=Flagellimonas amphidinii TaxID=2735167 RepID=UPI001C0ED782